MNFNDQKVEQVIKECAQQFIMPRYQALEPHDISSKSGPGDLVTQADIEAEEYLTHVLPDIYPGSVVIGEESVSQGNASLDVLKDTSQAIWVVDPVDGTYNFVQGRDTFGIMVALVIDGQTQAGWIYHVIQDDMITAQRGQGAYDNGKRLDLGSVEGGKPLNEMRAHISHKFFPKAMQNTIQDAAKQFLKSQPVGSAAHEYVRIARGQSDVSIYSRLKAWDHLPGALIVEEAGGHIAKWDGTSFEPHDDYAGLIISTHQRYWERARKAVFDTLDFK